MVGARDFPPQHSLIIKGLFERREHIAYDVLRMIKDGLSVSSYLEGLISQVLGCSDGVGIPRVSCWVRRRATGIGRLRPTLVNALSSLSGLEERSVLGSTSK